MIDSSSRLLAVAQLWLAASCRRRECGGPPSRLCSSLLQLCRPVAPGSLYTRCGQETDELMFQPHPLSNSGNVWAARPPFPPLPLPPSQGFARTCVYVCWRACWIIEQTLVALIGTSQSICLWLVGRLNPRWHHRAYNAWCLGLPSLVLSLQPHDWVCPFALEEPIPEKLWSLSGLSAPCAPWAYLQEKLAWPSLGFLPSGQRA